MDSLIRYRAWIVMAVTFVAVVLAVTLGAGTKGGGARSGDGVPAVSYGVQVRKLAPTSRLIYTNGWVASGGRQTIAVYAGTERANRRTGLLLIVRRTGAHEHSVLVTAPGSGTLTLLRPATPQSEQAAFSETLRFVTANGTTGTLNLAADRLSVSG